MTFYACNCAIARSWAPSEFLPYKIVKNWSNKFLKNAAFWDRLEGATSMVSPSEGPLTHRPTPSYSLTVMSAVESKLLLREHDQHGHPSCSWWLKIWYPHTSPHPVFQMFWSIIFTSIMVPLSTSTSICSPEYPRNLSPRYHEESIKVADPSWRHHGLTIAGTLPMKAILWSG